MSLLGWGKTSDLDIDDRSEVLLEVEQLVLSKAECETLYQTNEKLICTGEGPAIVEGEEQELGSCYV